VLLKCTRIIIKGLAKLIRLNEFSAVGSLASLKNSSIRSRAVTIQHVFSNRVVKEERLLHNKAESLTKLDNVVLSDIDSINQNLAKLRVVETHY